MEVRNRFNGNIMNSNLQMASTGDSAFNSSNEQNKIGSTGFNASNSVPYSSFSSLLNRSPAKGASSSSSSLSGSLSSLPAFPTGGASSSSMLDRMSLPVAPFTNIGNNPLFVSTRPPLLPTSNEASRVSFAPTSGTSSLNHPPGFSHPTSSSVPSSLAYPPNMLPSPSSSSSSFNFGSGLPPQSSSLIHMSSSNPINSLGSSALPAANLQFPKFPATSLTNATSRFDPFLTAPASSASLTTFFDEDALSDTEDSGGGFDSTSFLNPSSQSQFPSQSSTTAAPNSSSPAVPTHGGNTAKPPGLSRKVSSAVATPSGISFSSSINGPSPSASSSSASPSTAAPPIEYTDEQVELIKRGMADPDELAQQNAMKAAAAAAIDKEALEQIRKQMKDKIEAYQKRLDASNENTKRAREEVAKLRKLLEEWQKEKAEAFEKQRLANFRSSAARAAALSSNQSAADREEALARRRAELRRELVAGLEQMSLQDENAAGAGWAQRIVRNGEGGGLTQWLLQARTWYQDNKPLQRDVRWINARYGSGIASFFGFFQFMVMNAFFAVPIQMYLLVVQLMNNRSQVSKLQGPIPVWSAYSSFSEPLPYVGALFFTIVYLLFNALWKWVKEDEHELEMLEVDDGRPHTQFASIIFNLWDFGIEEPDACQDMRYSMDAQLRVMLNEQDIEARKQGRSRQDEILLWIRRGVGMFLNLCLIVGAWGAIIMSTIYSSAISSWFSANVSSLSFAAAFVNPLITSLINAILPKATFAITEFEKWDEPATLLKHQTWRLYMGKQLNIVINVFTSFMVARQTSLFGLSIEFDKSYTCPQDEVGANLVKLVLTEFVVSKVIKTITFVFKTIAQKTCFRNLKFDAFNVSAVMNDLLYFQLLIWITLPLFPLASVLGPLLLYFNFKFVMLDLTTFTSKANQAFSAKDTGTFFTIFYTSTVALAVTLCVYFLNTAYPCNAGPFRSVSSRIPWDYVDQVALSAGLDWVYSILTSPLLYIALWLVFMLRYGFKSNAVRFLQASLERDRAVHKQEVESLQALVEKKDRALENQKKANRV